MALIGKTRGVGDFRERKVGREKPARGEFDAQTADILADRTADFFAKDAREMHRMNVGLRRQFFERERLGKIFVQKIPRLFQPRRKLFFAAAAGCSRAPRRRRRAARLRREIRESNLPAPAPKTNPAAGIRGKSSCRAIRFFPSGSSLRRRTRRWRARGGGRVFQNRIRR